jgi:hypothetical protein
MPDTRTAAQAGTHAGTTTGAQAGTSASKNVFVIALDAFTRRQLESLQIASECVFHRMLSDEVLAGGEHGYDIDAMLRVGERQLEEFEGDVDAVIAYRDFPESTIQPLLARKAGVPTASLEAVLKCEHKYWSRLEQRRAIPDHVPRFVRFDPFDEDPRAAIDLDYPFWMKPVKSFASHLGFRIRDEADFRRALGETRMHIRRLNGPFDRLLELAELPAEVGGVGQTWCMAEQIIGGHQVTLEGCVFKGHPYPFGVVDSVRVPESSVFARYQYPSKLPGSVQERMSELTQRLVTQLGYDNAPFNIEFYWDEPADRIWLLEINPRIALHHADIFEKVDGLSNYAMAVDVALGREPSFPRTGGEHTCAATFFLREFEDAFVTRVPSVEQLQRIEVDNPGTFIELRAKEGQRLSQMAEQDAYSYALALVYVGADDEEQLEAKYHRIVEELDIGLSRATP